MMFEVLIVDGTVKVLRIIKKVSRFWKNWTVHNIVAHPVSEILYLISLPFLGREKAESISGWIHDVTLPDQVRGTGRG